MTAKISPWTPSPEAHQTCEKLFKDSPVHNGTAKFTYSTEHDFGKVIHSLLLCEPLTGFSSCFFQNMKQIAKLEGFKIQASGSVHSVRDPKLLAGDGKILRPSCSPSLEIASERMGRRIAFLKEHPSVCSQHESFKTFTLGQVYKTNMQIRADEGIDPNKVRNSRIYFEGGDCIHLTNSSQTPKWVIGEDLSTMTHMALRKDGWFVKNDPKAPSESYKYEKAQSNTPDTLNKQFLEGKIPGLIDEKAKYLATKLNETQIKLTLCEMLSMKLITKFEFDSKEDKEKGTDIACKYLAQSDFVEREIFPSELRTTAARVVFLKQLAYHNDIMMAPGPRGSIFLQDFNKSLEVLESIQKNADLLKLTEYDRFNVDEFITVTTALSKELNPLFEKAKKTLEEAGFKVIPAPGAFYTFEFNPTAKSPTKLGALNFNFLNAICGYSPKNNRQYWICGRAETTETLGSRLMDYWSEFVNSHCKDTAVYFLGQDPKHSTGLSESQKYFSEYQAGPRCLSFELETESHTV